MYDKCQLETEIILDTCMKNYPLFLVHLFNYVNENLLRVRLVVITFDRSYLYSVTHWSYLMSIHINIEIMLFYADCEF